MSPVQSLLLLHPQLPPKWQMGPPLQLAVQSVHAPPPPPHSVSSASPETHIPELEQQPWLHMRPPAQLVPHVFPLHAWFIAQSPATLQPQTPPVESVMHLSFVKLIVQSVQEPPLSPH